MNNSVIQIPEKMAGFVKVERFDGPIEDGKCNGVWDFHNLILNSGIDLFCLNNSTLAALVSRCSVGSNNTAPALGQTLLLSPLGSVTGPTDQGTTYIPGPPAYSQRSFQYDFSVGAIVGNVAEIGIGPGTYNVTPLLSRALVLDGGGSPTVVSVLVTESLRVTYYIRNYIYSSDIVGVVTIGGINYNYVIRAATWNNDPTNYGLLGSFGGISSQVGGSWIFNSSLNLTTRGVSGVGTIAAFSTQTLNTIANIPANTGGAVGCGFYTNVAYTAGDYYKDAIITIGLTEANTLTGGIGSIVYGGNFGFYQMSFTPKLPKTALNAFALVLRITPSNYP